jgi:hypothetical protein
MATRGFIFREITRKKLFITRTDHNRMLNIVAEHSKETASFLVAKIQF